MPSSFKTEKLGLNFWANIDRPVRSDFNLDNAAIDSAVGDHIENNLLHLNENDRSRLRDTYSITQLQGTDTASRQITLDFAPSLVVYYAVDKPPSLYTDGVNKIYFAVTAKESGGSGGISLSCSTVTISQTTSGDLRYDLNNSARQYVLIAVR